MIIYSKTLWGFPLLTRVYGSALPRSMAPALVSGLITLGLLLMRDRLQHLWVHPYAYQPLVLIVTFVLTFRSNYAYQRHWEAYTHMQAMTARWLDAAVQAIMFDRHPQPPGDTKSAAPSAAASHHQFVAELIHLVSLMHATCCAALRRDPDVANLVRHCRLSEAPPSDPAQLHLHRISGSQPGSPHAAAGAAADGAATPRRGRRRSGEGNAFTAAAAAAEGGDSSGAAAAAAAGGGGLVGRWAISAGLPSYRHDVSIVGAANWRDIFMLRGSPHAVSEYNSAQPLPVIGGVTKQELAALGCKAPQRKQRRQAAAAMPAGCGLGSVDEDGEQQQHHQSGQRLPAGSAAAEAAAGRSSGSSVRTLWGMLRHRAAMQPAGQQHVFGPARSMSFSEGVGLGCEHMHSQQQQYSQQQQQAPLAARSASDNLYSYGHNSSSSNGHGSSSTNVLSLGRLVQLSGYFDIAALSSKLHTFGRSPSNPSLTALAGASGSPPGLARPASLKRSVAPPRPRRFRVSLNRTCCCAHLPYMDRPLLLLSWVHELLLQRQSVGGLRMAAPILARVYTGLSDGLHAYEQCRKLADTPFPFPWAQFVLVMLVLFTVTLPLLVMAYVQDSGLAVAITVLTTCTFWTVNEVARDVEDAFIMEPNNMPLANTQYHFNELLLTLSVAERPASGVVPVVLPMPPGMRLPGSIRAVGTCSDLAAAAAAAVADGASLSLGSSRPPGPTAAAAPGGVDGRVAGLREADGPAGLVEAHGLGSRAAAAALAPFGEQAAALDASPGGSSHYSGSGGALLPDLQQQQQQQLQQHFQFQQLDAPGSLHCRTSCPSPRFASHPGVAPAAAAAAGIGSIAAAHSHSISIGGGRAAGVAAGGEPLAAWADDCSSTRDGCSHSHSQCADSGREASAPHTADVAGAARPPLATLPPFFTPSAVEDGAGLAGWKQQPSSSDEMV